MDWLAKLNGQFDRASTAVKGGAGDPPGSAAAAVANVANTLAAVMAGAHIVRVHAVRQLVPVVRVADEIRKYHREH